MSIKIALAGNPNCGKTTLFNNLTGSNQYAQGCVCVCRYPFGNSRSSPFLPIGRCLLC